MASDPRWQPRPAGSVPPVVQVGRYRRTRRSPTLHMYVDVVEVGPYTCTVLYHPINGTPYTAQRPLTTAEGYLTRGVWLPPWPEEVQVSDGL